LVLAAGRSVCPQRDVGVSPTLGAENPLVAGWTHLALIDRMAI